MVIGGLGRIGMHSVVPLGFSATGASADDCQAIRSNPTPSGSRKVLRLIRLAEKFGHPVVTFYDPPIVPVANNVENWNQAELLARILLLLATVRVPIISAVVGPLTTDEVVTFGFADHLILMTPPTGMDSWSPLLANEVIPFSNARGAWARTVRSVAAHIGSALERFRTMSPEVLIQLREARSPWAAPDKEKRSQPGFNRLDSSGSQALCPR